MQQSDSYLRLKQMLLGEDDPGHEICALVESDPKTFYILAALLEDEDPEVRAEAISQTWNATYTSQTEFYEQQVHHVVGPLILALLDDPHPRVRSAAANSVSQFPDAPRELLLTEATPRLFQLLNEPDSEVQRSAAWSLRSAALTQAETQSEAALGVPSQLASHSNPEVRRAPAFIPANQVRKFTSVQDMVTSLLSTLANDGNGRVRREARKSLESFGGSTHPVEGLDEAMGERSNGYDAYIRAEVGFFRVLDGEATNEEYQKILSSINVALEEGLSPSQQANTLYMRGNIHLQQNHLEEAERDLREALQDPKLLDAEIYVNASQDLSGVAESSGDRDLQLRILEDAIESFPTLFDPSEELFAISRLRHKTALDYLGYISKLDGAGDRVSLHAQAALELNPDYPDAHLVLGVLHRHYAMQSNSTRDRELAIEHLEKYLQIVGTSAESGGDQVGIETALDCLNYLRQGTSQQAERSGCFIATAVYGDANHPDVVLLREFRDRILSASTVGKVFTRCYYLISPSLSTYLKGNSLKPLVKLSILVPTCWVARRKLHKLPTRSSRHDNSRMP
ncbi:MAG: hypothetical protein BZY87_01775 [SAR202 cluster bacterium Io17-Chloro-G6]|nr:MAG: hypothetical protein BZY87_01775 [SAR202 cluster bacterium Io17-Chloro-G6]